MNIITATNMNYRGWASMLTIMFIIFMLSIIGITFETAWTNIAIAIITGIIIIALIGIGHNRHTDE